MRTGDRGPAGRTASSRGGAGGAASGGDLHYVREPCRTSDAHGRDLGLCGAALAGGRLSAVNEHRFVRGHPQGASRPKSRESYESESPGDSPPRHGDLELRVRPVRRRAPPPLGRDGAAGGPATRERGLLAVRRASTARRPAHPRPRAASARGGGVRSRLDKRRASPRASRPTRKVRCSKEPWRAGDDCPIGAAGSAHLSARAARASPAEADELVARTRARRRHLCARPWPNWPAATHASVAAERAASAGKRWRACRCRAPLRRRGKMPSPWFARKRRPPHVGRRRSTSPSTRRPSGGGRAGRRLAHFSSGTSVSTRRRCAGRRARTQQNPP